MKTRVLSCVVLTIFCSIQLVSTVFADGAAVFDVAVPDLDIELNSYEILAAKKAKLALKPAPNAKTDSVVLSNGSLYATNVKKFMDSLFSQLSTNYQTAVAGGFFTQAEADTTLAQIEKRIDKIKKAADQYITKANKFASAKSRNTEVLLAAKPKKKGKKKKAKPKSSVFGKYPTKFAKGEDNLLMQRKILGGIEGGSALAISFLETLKGQIESFINSQSSTDAQKTSSLSLIAKFHSILTKALEKDITALVKNESSVNKARFNKVNKKKITAIPAGSYSGTSSDVSFGFNTTMMSSLTDQGVLMLTITPTSGSPVSLTINMVSDGKGGLSFSGNTIIGDLALKISSKGVVKGTLSNPTNVGLGSTSEVSIDGVMDATNNKAILDLRSKVPNSSGGAAHTIVNMS